MANLTGITINPLPLETVAKKGFTHVIIVDFTAIALMTSTTAQAVFPANALAAATTTMLAGARIERCAWRVATAFVFSPGTLVFSLGDGGDAARFIAAATDLKTAAYGEGAISKMPYTYAAADTIDLVVTAGAGALTSVTAGSLEIYLAKSDLSNLSSGVTP